MYFISARSKGLFLLLFLAAFAIRSFGQVSVSTSTVNVSADRAVGGSAESFTTIPSIIISDNAAGDFGAGNNRRFRLSLPAGWTFNDSAPLSVTRSGTNITSASGAFNAAGTFLTVTYTASGTTASDNEINISGLQVKPNSGVAGGPVYITRTALPATQAAAEAVINGFPIGYQVVGLNITPGAFVKLQVLLPGQTNAPGTVNGYTGTPTAQSAGTAITTTVNAVDNYFNVVTTAPADQVQLTSNVNGIMPSAQTLSSGVATVGVQLNQAGAGATISATDITNGGIISATSRSVTINALSFSKLQLLLPGETANPGSVSGKTGTPSSFVAGTASVVSARAVDQFWNLVSGIGTTTTVNLSSANASTPTITPGSGTSTLSNGGIRNFNVTYNVAGETPTLSVSNVTTPSVTSDTSPSFSVVAGSYAKLQILLPGETSAPGTTSGKVGTVSPVTAGSSVTVTINAVDAEWNLISSVNNQVIVASSRNAQIPSPITLVNGTATISAILTTVGAQAVSGTDTTTSFVGASSNITVTAGTYAKLLLILPGETHDPGSATGKTGTATDRVSGQSFQITVLSVDQNWNQVPSTGNPIAITSNDISATLPANNTLGANGNRNFNVTLRAASSTSTLTATDTLDPTKTAYTTSNINVIAGAATKLIVLMPGETPAFGTTTGKTGTPNPVVAGNNMSVSVYALDAANNLATSATDLVSLAATNDVYASITPANVNLVNGAANFGVIFRTAGNNRRLTAVDETTGNGTMSNGLSPTFTVAVGAYSKILAILPDQAHEPGSATGVSGTLNIPARGTTFLIQLIAVDDNFNRVLGITNTLNRTSISDATATGLPVTSSFNNGLRNFPNANFKAAGTQSVTYNDTVTGFSIVVVVPDQTVGTTATDNFRSNIASGNWSIPSNWQSSSDGVTWITSTLAPTSLAASITIRNGHTITITNASGSLSVDDVVIETGAQVNVNGGAALTIANGAAAVDFIVNGTLQSARPITVTGAVQFSSTGVYQHAFTGGGGTIPAATWDTGSICEIRGYTTFTNNVGGTNQAFSDFVWNTPNMTGSPSINSVFNARNFTVISTGSGTMNIGATGSNAVAISGTYTQNAGNVGIAKTSGSRNVTIAGNFNLLGGTLSKGVGTASITFNGTAVQNFVKSSSTISGALNFAVSASSTLNFGTNVLDGSSGTFNAANGSAIITANADGLNATALSGSVQVTGTRTYGSRVYTYNGSVAQLSGDGLPTTLNSLTVINSNGVTLPSTTNTYSIANSLTINPSSGSLNLGQNILAGAYADSGTGRIVTQAPSGALPTGRTWILGVDFGSASAQNIISANYRDLYTSNSGVKTAPAGTLNVSGNWSSAGGNVDFVTNNTALVFNGTTQSLTDAGSNSGAGLLFKNVTFNGGGIKTLTSGTFSLKNDGLLNVTGSTNLNANGNLTLLSDASSTASIGQLTGGAQISGSVRANRFVTGNNDMQYRTWRGMSSPVDVSGGTYNLNQLIDNIIITGSGGATNGFDATTGNGQSAFTYGGSGFVEIPTTSTPIPVGKGIFLTFRGNRNNLAGKTTPPFVVPENTVVDFVGTLNQGNINTGLTYAGASTPTNLLGNPYASSISWSQLYTNNSAVLANDFVRIWNPLTRSYNFTGAGDNTVISSGQGFFVVVTPSAGTFSFTESVKTTTQPSSLLMSSPSFDGLQLNQDDVAGKGKTMVGGNSALASGNPTVKMKIVYPGTFNQDNAVVEFKSGASSNYSVNEDLVYWPADSVRLATMSTDNRVLAYSRMPELANTSTVRLALDAVKTGNYNISFDLLNLSSGTLVELKDNYLNTTTTITSGQSITINIDKAVPSTFGANRLSLSLSPIVTLPVEFVSFQGKKTNSGVMLDWTTKSESNNSYFEVQRAGEDKKFISLPKVTAKNTASTYSLLDSKPLKGNNYYKLIQVDNDGTSSTYKDLVSVYFDGLSSSSFAVYPNPVLDKATVKYEGILNERNFVKITSTTGQVLLNVNVSASDLNNGYEINVGNYAPGLYVIELVDAVSLKRVTTQKLVKR